ncbi:P-loop containing nucleoside triphosphate hydrolase protein [Penicillium brevicompactum]|uniref:P-loop containing nucleoside triphosphate hydrolase protein n=1 Tax=Penicillium brevicompactum TaxID=5074 RepID=UPI0025412E0E|nr:P-loop containing nucleoside triphosphate hydrolase protein [Penicillium brevicompactum]KAJ5332325.1 P-loop containing nucleoside triphosphate hydrolase protein [Penicillium brevicompactum]
MDRSIFQPLADRPESPIEPLSTIPFRRDRDFVNRGTLLDQLQDKASVPGSRVALVGLGGVGKSQLAIEYCYRLRDKSPNTWVIWIYASNATRFEQSCRDVADQVRIPGRKIPKVNILKLLRDWLHGKRDWILVFDNVDEIQFLVESYSMGHEDTQDMRLGSDIQTRTIWSYFPESLTGSIIITSRNRGGVSKLIEDYDIISVDPMDQEVGCLLFEKKLGMKADQDEVIRLINMLESMPLAIAQAAAYIRQRAPRYSVKKYLEDFQKSDRKRTTLLKYGEGTYRRDEEAENAILLTWQITFNHLRQERPSAANLLSLMSFFDRQKIPDSLLKGQTEDEGDNWSLRPGSDIGSMSDSRSDASSDLSESMFEKLQRMAEDDTQEAADIFLHSPPPEKNEHNWEANNADEESKPGFDCFFHDQGEIEGENGDFDIDGLSDSETESTDYDSDIQSFSNDFEDDILTLRNYSLIAIGAIETHLAMHRLVQLATQEWLHDHNELEKWKSSFVKVLYLNFPQPKFENRQQCETIFPHVQSATLQKSPANAVLEEWATVLYRASSYLYENRSFIDSSRMAELSTSIRQTLFGPENHQTIESVEMLALSYLYRDLYKKAETLLERVVASRKRDLGEVHPATLASMGNLGDVYRFQTRWDEAEELQVQVMNSHKKMFGLEHPDTLTSMGLLADTLMDRRRFTEAEALAKEAIESQKKVFGPEHPETMRMVDTLALIFVEQKRPKDAEKLRLEEVEVYTRILGIENESTLSAMVGLANAYQIQRRFEEAKKVYTKVLETRKKTLGENHPETLSSLFNLAWICFDTKQWAQAEGIFEQVVRGQEKVLGREHPSTLSTFSHLANVYMQQQRWEKSEEIYKMVLKRREKVLGPQHPFTLGSMVSMGNLCSRQGRWKETEVFYKRALQGRENIFRADEVLILDLVAALGVVYKQQKQWTQAEASYMRVLKGREAALGKDHPTSVESMMQLASVHQEQEQWLQAEEITVQALQSQENSIGAGASATLSTMAQLAFVYEQQGKWSKSKELYERTLERKDNDTASESPATVQFMLALAYVYAEKRQWAQSEKVYIRGLDICKQVMGEENNQSLWAMTRLAYVYWNLETDANGMEKAKDLYAHVFETRKRLLGDEHPDTLVSMEHMINVFRSFEQEKEALELETKLAELRGTV